MSVRVGPPEGLLQAEARIAGIKARFRAPGGSFAGALSRALGAGFAQPAMGEAKAMPIPVHDAIKRAAASAGVDADLLLAVAEAESGLRADATSPKGAMGLMQLMPSTAAMLGVEDAFDVEQSARGGAAYLRQLLDRFGGDIGLSVAAYNAGPGAVERYAGTPPFGETRRFVARVLSRLSELNSPGASTEASR